MAKSGSKTAPAKAMQKNLKDKETGTSAVTSKKEPAPIVTEKPLTLSNREQEMIAEINILRTNPPLYVNYINSYLDKNEADAKVRKAAAEVIDQLKKMPPIGRLSLNPFMYQDAKKFGSTMATNNYFGHSDLPYAENLSLGYANIREAIIDLLIDDDVVDRGHRKNLLNDKLTFVAVYELPGKIQDIPYCYVQVFK
jgi:uncharacterized protein YkwD